MYQQELARLKAKLRELGLDLPLCPHLSIINQK